MSARIKGWCPSAHRPMMSGDGLLVRVRPAMAQLSAQDVLVLCDLARRFGNGMIDITSRANLQIRGVSEADHAGLLAALIDAELVAADPLKEAARITTVTPLWRKGDLTTRLAAALENASLPILPDKMGVVLDTGETPVLQDTPGDFRFETAASGGMILRADGAETGREIEESEATNALAQMIDWFLDTGGAQSGRMARHLKTKAIPKAWCASRPAACGNRPMPGATEKGALFGVPFGQTDADALAELLAATGATHLRVTPWRMLLSEGGAAHATPGFRLYPDPLLNVSACPGAPACAQSTVKTRDLARGLCGHVKGTLHVSGCAKGCASRAPADITLVGRDGRFDLVHAGRPGDTPDQSGLSEADTLKQLAHIDAV